MFRLDVVEIAGAGVDGETDEPAEEDVAPDPTGDGMGESGAVGLIAEGGLLSARDGFGGESIERILQLYESHFRTRECIGFSFYSLLFLFYSLLYARDAAKGREPAWLLDFCSSAAG